MTKVTRTEDLFSGLSIPMWALGSTTVTKDDGLSDRKGEYGYECHQLQAGDLVIGWVYDTGAGYEWVDGPQQPEPYDAGQRGGWQA